MKTVYLDIFSGISGDMFIGAMLDLGVDFDALQKQLERLGLDDFHLHSHRGQKCGIEGIKFNVHLEDHDNDHDHGHEQSHSHGHSHSHSHSHSDHQSHEHHHEDGHHHNHE